MSSVSVSHLYDLSVAWDLEYLPCFKFFEYPSPYTPSKMNTVMSNLLINDAEKTGMFYRITKPLRVVVHDAAEKTASGNKH